MRGIQHQEQTASANVLYHLTDKLFFQTTLVIIQVYFIPEQIGDRSFAPISERANPV